MVLIVLALLAILALAHRRVRTLDTALPPATSSAPAVTALLVAAVALVGMLLVG